MKSTRLFLAVLIMALAPLCVKAQMYKTSLGVFVGTPTGLSMKTNFTDRHGMELIGGIRFNNGTQINGLYEYTMNIGLNSGAAWYVGGGLHTAFYYKEKADRAFGVGLVGAAGIEYTPQQAPFNFAITFMPGFSTYSWLYDVGISIRYIIKE